MHAISHWQSSLDYQHAYLSKEIEKIHKRTRRDKSAQDNIDHAQSVDFKAYNSYLLSNLTLGSVIVVIKQNHLQNLIFDFRKHRLDFRDFCDLNRRVDLKLPNYHKVNVILNLFSNLRNACFHWENLAKTRVKDGIAYPRLSVRIWSAEMGLHSKRIVNLAYEKIEHFLEFLLQNLGQKT